MKKVYINVEIIFFSENESGRHCMPCGTGYSPHFIVMGSEKYLGVRFIDVPMNIKPNISYNQQVELLYPDTVEYDSLKEGIEFQIIEGPKIVGQGIVRENIKKIIT